jgi:hypothetical protein
LVPASAACSRLGYFRVCSERLKARGTMLLQAIVIPDQRYDPLATLFH